MNSPDKPTQSKKTIHCFFSGGRDSAVACFIAKKLADAKGWKYNLVNIDTTISIKQTKRYIEEYAKWLDTNLIIIRPKETFKELAAKRGMWPSLNPNNHRWCYFDLKLKPTIKYLKENYKPNDIVTLGIRKWESRQRRKLYKKTFFIKDYNGIKALVWLPLLHVDDQTLEKLVVKFNIPRNPVWKFGFSGECLCLAGTPEMTIGIIFRNFPEETQELLEIDRIINKNRKSKKPSAPPSIFRKGFKTLEEYYNYAKLQTQLDMFIYPYGLKSCQGTCML